MLVRRYREQTFYDFVMTTPSGALERGAAGIIWLVGVDPSCASRILKDISQSSHSRLVISFE